MNSFIIGWNRLNISSILLVDSIPFLFRTFFGGVSICYHCQWAVKAMFEMIWDGAVWWCRLMYWIWMLWAFGHFISVFDTSIYRSEDQCSCCSSHHGRSGVELRELFRRFSLSQWRPIQRLVLNVGNGWECSIITLDGPIGLGFFMNINEH